MSLGWFMTVPCLKRHLVAKPGDWHSGANPDPQPAAK